VPRKPRHAPVRAPCEWRSVLASAAMKGGSQQAEDKMQAQAPHSRTRFQPVASTTGSCPTPLVEVGRF